MIEWIDAHSMLLWLSSAISFAVLVGSFFLVPFLVSRIRPDYFAHERRPDRSWINLSPPVRLLIHVGKNLLGTLLLVVGLAMLVLPGPGLITLLVGFFLLDFPGKYRFEKWLVEKKPVHRPINWLRQRSGRQPLVLRR